jgi:hypothetical protein
MTNHEYGEIAFMAACCIVVVLVFVGSMMGLLMLMDHQLFEAINECVKNSDGTADAIRACQE